MDDQDLIKADGSTPWASPKEFEGSGKQIEIVNFEELTLEQVIERDKRTPKYPPMDGIVRRLTFHDAGSNLPRTLDINSNKFQRDLAGRGIKKGSVGILRREKNVATGKVYNWYWTPV